MYTLALDTTSKTMSAAVFRDGTMAGELFVDSGNTHSETMLPAIERLLGSLSLSPADIGLYAVTRGPGSFTGVRIGIATVKGLAFRDVGEPEIPIAPVSTLLSLAYYFQGFGSEEHPVLVAPVMDARRSQVYTAAFSVSGGTPERLAPDSALSLEDLGEQLTELSGGRTVYFAGDGYSLAKDHFGRPGLRDRISVADTPAPLQRLRGSSIAVCGLEAFHRGETVNERTLVPSYLRGI